MPIQRSPVNAPRILVTEEDPEIRKLFVTNLRTAGYWACEARLGQETLKLLGRMHFSLLILDLDTDGADSFEMLKLVKAKHPGVHVVAISGYMDGALLGAAECLGATLSLGRRNAPRMLLGTVRKLLGESS